MKSKKFLLHNGKVSSARNNLISMTILLVFIAIIIVFGKDYIVKHGYAFLGGFIGAGLGQLIKLILDLLKERIKIITFSETGFELRTLKKKKSFNWEDVTVIKENLFVRGRYFYSITVKSRAEDTEPDYFIEKTKKTAYIINAFYPHKIQKAIGDEVFQATNWVRSTQRFSGLYFAATSLMFVCLYIIFYESDYPAQIMNLMLYSFTGILIIEIMMAVRKMIKLRTSRLTQGKDGITVYEKGQAHFFKWEDVKNIRMEKASFQGIDINNLIFDVNSTSNFSYESIIIESSLNFYYKALKLKRVL